MPDGILTRSLSSTNFGPRSRGIDLSPQDRTELLIRSKSTHQIGIAGPSTDNSQASTPEGVSLLSTYMQRTTDDLCIEELRHLTATRPDSPSTDSRETDIFLTPCEIVKSETPLETQDQFEFDDIAKYSRVDVKKILSTPVSNGYFTPRSSFSSPSTHSQFQIDDVPIAGDIFKRELNKLKKIVSKQSGFNSQDQNPFGIPLETVPSPAIYNLLKSFIDDCLKKDNTKYLIDEYKSDLITLLKDFRIFEEVTATKILSHLLNKSLESLKANKNTCSNTNL